MRSSCTFPSARARRRAAAPLLATIAIGCALGTVHAADPDREPSQYIRDRWDSSRGFPGGPVHAISQTPDGYLWISVEKGLVRFDGVTFRLFHPTEKTSGTDSAALDIAADSSGILWARLRRAALVRYRSGAFEDLLRSMSQPNLMVTAMAIGRDGAMFVADSRRGVLAVRGDRIETVVASSALPQSFVTSIAQTPSADIWLGTRDAGLVRVRAGQATPITAGLPDPKINCLAADVREQVWIGTDRGVARWDGHVVTRAGLPDALNHVRATVMIEDRDANLWIGTPEGVLRLNSRGLTTVDRLQPESAVTALFEDREGNLWIGTTRGIERWRDGAFVTFPEVRAISSGSSGPVYADAADHVWFGPASGGLFWFHDGRAERVTAAGLSDDVIYSIAGSGDDLWIARQRGGLTHLRAAGNAFTSQTATRADGLAQDNVYTVHRARDGGVWAGTLSGGVSRVKDGAFTTYTTADGLASNTVAAILEATDGAVWFGTPNGASVKSSGGWKRYSTADGLPSNDVNTVFEDSARNVWVGTAAGLAVLRDGRMQSPPAVPALLRASIVGLSEDRAGGLWIAATDRILRVDRERLLRGALGAGDVREFSAADGLLDTETTKRHRVMATDSRGRLWLSTNAGLVMSDPRRVAASVAPALVHVEDVSADGRPVERTTTITIPPRRDRLTFSFAALSLSVPDRVRFRYRLDGFDRDWSDPVSEHQAVFTNLGPGAYRFRVIASNSDGVWNSAEAALPFTIAPAWWQTVWFWAAAVLGAAGAVWAGYRLRLQQLARQLDVRFEERLAERTRIARELHDTLLQSFQGAVLRFRAVTYMLPDRPAEARATLENAIDQAREAIIEGRDAVQGLRSAATASNDIAVAIGTLADTLATDHGGESPPAVRVNVEGTPRDLPPIVRDEVYRIGGEALRNAFRHARAAQIEVDIRYDDRRFRLRVRDDGKGIDQDEVARRTGNGHFGLAGMHERAKLVGGTLSVWSELDSGTEAELTIPASVAYAKPAAV